MTPEERRKVRRAHALAHAQAQREAWAVALADVDREVLEMRDVQHLTFDQMAIRLGLSRAGAKDKVRRARRREEVRSGLPQKL